MIEEWKTIEGYENYKVSNFGRIKSLNYNRTGVEKILKPAKHRDGYLLVYLCRNGKGKWFLLHRLVAEAFLPNPEGFEQVNHRNEDKTNNVVDNLEWCSRWYNMHFGTMQERAAASKINHPALSKAVEASKYPDFRTIELRFASTQEAKRNGYAQSNVSACCRWCYSTHRRNFYKGLYWRYVK